PPPQPPPPASPMRHAPSERCTARRADSPACTEQVWATESRPRTESSQVPLTPCAPRWRPHHAEQTSAAADDRQSSATIVHHRRRIPSTEHGAAEGGGAAEPRLATPHPASYRRRPLFRLFQW